MLNATLNESNLTSFVVLADGCQIAVGYSNGAILLFTGRFLRESGSQIRSSAYTVLLPNHMYAVSALYFYEIFPRRSTERRIRLFAVMDSDSRDVDLSSVPLQRPPEPSINGDNPADAGVLVFDTSITTNTNGVSSLSSHNSNYNFANSNNSNYIAAPRHAPKSLDDRGASAKCSSFMRGTSELVVARNEAVYNYSIEDKGGALAITGEKLCICSGNRDHIAIATEVNYLVILLLFNGF